MAWRMWEAKSSSSVSEDQKGNRTYTAPWFVETDGVRVAAKEVLDYVEAQGYGHGSTYSYLDEADGGVFRTGAAPKRIDGALEQWLVTLTYTVPDPEDEEQDEDGNPTDNPLDFRMRHEWANIPYEVAAKHCWNYTAIPVAGTSSYNRPQDTPGPCTNSAGVPFDPPPTKTEHIRVWRVTAYLQDYDLGLLEQVDKINTAPMKFHNDLITKYNFEQVPGLTYFPTASVKLADVGATFRVQNNVKYWEYTLEWHIRFWGTLTGQPRGWLEPMLDRGFARRAGAGDPDGRGGSDISSGDLEEAMARVTPIRDLDGSRVPEIILLDGAGQPATGDDEKNGVYLYYRFNEWTDFQANVPFHLWVNY